MGPPRRARSQRETGGTGVNWALVGAVLVEAAVLVWSLVQPDELLLGLLVMGPLITAAFASVRATGAMAVAAGLSATLLAAQAGLLNHPAHVSRVAGVLAGSALAVFVAVERRRRDVQLRRVQRVADVAQAAILRPVPRRLRGLECAARYQSATLEARVGGDFYEILDTPFGVRALVGDVRGKGIDATRLAAVLLGCFREASGHESQLESIAKLLDDRALLYGEDEDFATAALLEFGDRLKLVNCGHPAPLRLWGQGTDELRSTPTAALGLGASPAGEHFEFEPGDTVLTFTDGLIEARDKAGSFFDLAAAVSRASSREPEALLDGLVRRVTGHVGHRLDDDVAMLAVRKPQSVGRSVPESRPRHTRDSARRALQTQRKEKSK